MREQISSHYRQASRHNGTRAKKLPTVLGGMPKIVQGTHDEKHQSG